MKCYVLFYTLTVLIIDICQCNDRLNTTCGLQENSITDLPWVAYIPLETRTYNPDADVRCMGALINDRYVITSSTCLQFVVRYVKFGQFKIGVERWIASDDADIALLKLSEEVKLSDTVQPICLPFDEAEKPEKKTTYYVPGWGESDGAKKLVKNKEVDCKTEKANSVCLNHIGTNTVCNGDEGSPVMYKNNDRWVLYGVVSFAFDDNNSPCAESSPSVATKITDKVLNWIVKTIE